MNRPILLVSIASLLMLVAVAKAQNFSGTPEEEPAAPSDAAASSSAAPAEGESVDLRHHWKRPYSYGYGSNYYGGYAYPSYYGNYGYSNNIYNYQRPAYGYNSYPSYGYGYGGGGGGNYDNYYSSYQQSYSSGGSYYGLGYREKEANKDAPVPSEAAESTGDSIKFN